MKILEISRYSQRDSRWANQRLGTVNGTTIGSDGCVISCHAMRLTWGGKAMTPADLDNFLTDNNLYYSGNLWVPSRASQIWDKYKYIKTTYCENTPAPIADIKTAIDRGQPPTLWVINGGVRHNVLAVGYDGDQIYVNDPWMGDRVRMDQRWGNSASVILSVDYYEGPMPDSTTYVQVPSKDFEGMVFKSTQHDKTSKNWGFDDPRNTTAEQIDDKIQKSINAYKGQVSQSQAEAAQAKKDLAIAQQEVKNREEQVSRLKEQLINSENDKKEQIDALNMRLLESEKTVSDLRADVSVKQTEIDAVYKQKGALQNELAGVKKELETCQAGGPKPPTKSLWEVIWEFLTKTKVQS